MPHVLATVVDGKVTIVATAAGDQIDTPQPTVVRGTDSTADTTPELLKVQDGAGGLDWSTPVEDGIDGTDGVRGAGQFPGNVTLSAGASAPLVVSMDTGSGSFFADALALIIARLGAGSLPVDGDVAIITYTQTDSTVQTRSGTFSGTAWADFDYQIDGNLLVTGSVVADTVNANTVIANDVASFGFLTGETGYKLYGTDNSVDMKLAGDAEFNNVTIRGNSTVESSSINGTGIWGVAEQGLSIMTAQSFADGQHSLNILEQIGTPIQYSFNDYNLGDWSIDTVGSDVILSLGTSTSSGASVPNDAPGAIFPTGVTGGFIVRWFQNNNTSFFQAWTSTGFAAPGITTTISNNSLLSGPGIVAGDSQPGTVTFFNGITNPTRTEFTSYIVRQDGAFTLDPDMLIQFERVAPTDGTTGGAITISDLELTLRFEPVEDAADMMTPPATPNLRTPSITLTETAPAVGQTVGTRALAFTDPTDMRDITTIVQFGTDQRLEFQPAAFGTSLPQVEIGTIVRLQLRFVAAGDTGNTAFRGLGVFSNVRDISLAGGAPSLFSTLALDTTDTIASIGSDDINKFSLTVAGGRGLRVIYDRVFAGRSKTVNGIDLGKSGFIMVRWNNGSPNENTPNTGIYPFQNAFFTTAGDQLIKSTTNLNEEYFFGDVGDTEVETSAIKLVDVIDNAGSRKGSLWTKVTLSGLATQLILDTTGGDASADIIGVFITSWNFGTIRAVNEI